MTFDERVKKVMADQIWQIMQLQQQLEKITMELIDCKAKRREAND